MHVCVKADLALYSGLVYHMAHDLNLVTDL